MQVDLLSDDDQAEVLRAWLKKNGSSMLTAVVVALVAFGGWRWWLSHTESRALQANAAYEQALQAFDAGQLDAAIAQVDELRRQQPKSVYALAAQLAAVRVLVDNGQLDQAEQRLKDVLGTLPDPNLRPIVTLRLARVQSALGRNDDALATLGTAGEGPFAAAFAEARGDIRVAKGDSDGARRDYEQALALLDTDGPSTAPLVQLKLDDLALPAAAAAAVAQAASDTGAAQ